MEEMGKFGFSSRQILLLIAASTLVLSGCSMFGGGSRGSVKPKEFSHPECGPTAINIQDFAQFGLKPTPGKITVMRVFATWCPFCKKDLAQIVRNFQTGRWHSDNIQIFLMAYKNHSENQSTFDQWKREVLPTLGLPVGNVTAVYIDKTYSELTALNSKTGLPLFENWQGVPFALVFGKDQRLAYRGHFTMSDVSEDIHYQFIDKLQRETCH